MFKAMRFVGRARYDAPTARGGPWLALALALALSTLPDCCLLGHHVHGLGMEAFGVICSAKS